MSGSRMKIIKITIKFKPIFIYGKKYKTFEKIISFNDRH